MWRTLKFVVYFSRTIDEVTYVSSFVRWASREGRIEGVDIPGAVD
jgi:hypothetical protein